MKYIAPFGTSMGDDDWPYGIKFAHFIQMSDAWRNNFTRISEWRSLAGEMIPDAVHGEVENDHQDYE